MDDINLFEAANDGYDFQPYDFNDFKEDHSVIARWNDMKLKYDATRAARSEAELKDTAVRILEETHCPHLAELARALTFKFIPKSDKKSIAYLEPSNGIIRIAPDVDAEQVVTLIKHEVAHAFLKHQMRIEQHFADSHGVDVDLAKSYLSTDPIHKAFNVAADMEISNRIYTEEDKKTAVHIRKGREFVRGIVTEIGDEDWVPGKPEWTKPHPEWAKWTMEDIYDELEEEAMTALKRAEAQRKKMRELMGDDDEIVDTAPPEKGSDGSDDNPGYGDEDDGSEAGSGGSNDSTDSDYGSNGSDDGDSSDGRDGSEEDGSEGDAGSGKTPGEDGSPSGNGSDNGNNPVYGDEDGTDSSSDNNSSGEPGTSGSDDSNGSDDSTDSGESSDDGEGSDGSDDGGSPTHGDSDDFGDDYGDDSSDDYDFDDWRQGDDLPELPPKKNIDDRRNGDPANNPLVDGQKDISDTPSELDDEEEWDEGEGPVLIDEHDLTPAEKRMIEKARKQLEDPTSLKDYYSELQKAKELDKILTDGKVNSSGVAGSLILSFRNFISKQVTAEERKATYAVADKKDRLRRLGINKRGHHYVDVPNIPEVRVYFDRSGSWADNEKHKIGYDLANSIAQFQRQGKLKVSYRWFNSRGLSDHDVPASGGDRAENVLLDIAALQKEKERKGGILNVVVITDSDPGRYNDNFGPSVQVNGGVWLVFVQNAANKSGGLDAVYSEPLDRNITTKNPANKVIKILYSKPGGK